MHTNALRSLYLQSPKLNQLNILREVAANAKITQAELAKLCSLSVAMVNNYMKELCRSGLIEYHRRSSKSVTYHLTHAGKRHLDVLRAEMDDELVGMFVAAKEQIRDRIASKARSSLQRVVLFGTGHLAQLVFHALDLPGTNIVGICTDDLDAVGKDFCGREVLNSSQIRYIAPDTVVVADPPKTEETRRTFESLSVKGIKIIRLDSHSAMKIAKNPGGHSAGTDLSAASDLEDDSIPLSG